MISEENRKEGKPKEKKKNGALAVNSRSPPLFFLFAFFFSFSFLFCIDFFPSSPFCNEIRETIMGCEMRLESVSDCF